LPIGLRFSRCRRDDLGHIEFGSWLLRRSQRWRFCLSVNGPQSRQAVGVIQCRATVRARCVMDLSLALSKQPWSGSAKGWYQ
jgi:hypothetical protein